MGCASSDAGADPLADSFDDLEPLEVKPARSAPSLGASSATVLGHHLSPQATASKVSHPGTVSSSSTWIAPHPEWCGMLSRGHSSAAGSIADVSVAGAQLPPRSGPQPRAGPPQLAFAAPTATATATAVGDTAGRAVAPRAWGSGSFGEAERKGGGGDDGSSVESSCDDGSEAEAHAPVHAALARLDEDGATIHFQLGDIIARGTSGIVYAAQSDTGGTLMAAKVLDVATQHLDATSVERQVRLLREMEHPNIVAYLGTRVIDGMVFIFTQLSAAGSLRAHAQRFGALRPRLVRRYTSDVLSCLQYLHSKGVAHGGINPDHLLLSDQGAVRVAGFGNARRVTASESGGDAGASAATSGASKAACYASPELLRGDGGDTRPGDVWALACTVLELVTGAAPWCQLSVARGAGLAAHIAAAETGPPIPDGVPTPLQGFLGRCFRVNPADRPTASELLDDPWLQDASPAHDADSSAEPQGVPSDDKDVRPGRASVVTVSPDQR